tara:strand:- start:9007 stop:9210 length:204 start_codon:yes stop_codon:yes gene_type:complete
MSNKKKRLNSLVAIRNTLNSPITGAGKNAQRCSYNKSTVLLLIEEVEKLLAADGVFAMPADSKVNVN